MGARAYIAVIIRSTSRKREQRIALVTSIRDVAVEMIRSEGTWKPCRVGDEQRNVMGLRFGSLCMSLTTPFQKFHMEPPKIPDRFKGNLDRYAVAVRMSQSKRHLGFGLDVWGKVGKVLNVHWNEYGRSKSSHLSAATGKKRFLARLSLERGDRLDLGPWQPKLLQRGTGRKAHGPK